MVYHLCCSESAIPAALLKGAITVCVCVCLCVCLCVCEHERESEPESDGEGSECHRRARMYFLHEQTEWSFGRPVPHIFCGGGEALDGLFI